MTKSAAVEYAEQGIRVNAVCPAIRTPMMDQLPAHVHSSFVTGIALPVDAGATAF